ncbi:MAG: nucleotidyl transferase AbiEii/AbiGii toxin family protein [Chlamydiota bacterium]
MVVTISKRAPWNLGKQMLQIFPEPCEKCGLAHPHMHYTGVQVALLARLGKTKTHMQIDLGFGDIVEPINYPINLTSTRKGPLFESQIHLSCYPKEFIFAEKLETSVHDKNLPLGVSKDKAKPF